MKNKKLLDIEKQYAYLDGKHAALDNDIEFFKSKSFFYLIKIPEILPQFVRGYSDYNAKD